MRVVFSAARQQSLFVPRTPFLAQTLKQFYVSSPTHLFTKPFLLIFRTVVQSPRYGRRRVKIFNLEGIQILRHVMVVVLLFPSFLGCAFLRRRRRRRRHQNRVRSEDDEESARRTNGFSLPHEEWVPGDGMKQLQKRIQKKNIIKGTMKHAKFNLFFLHKRANTQRKRTRSLRHHRANKEL